MVAGVARKGKGKKGGMKSDMNGINLREEREKTEREREERRDDDLVHHSSDDPLDRKLGGTINVVNRLYLVRK